MNFVSYEFIFLMIITLLAYAITPLQHRWMVLLLASGYFAFSSSGLEAFIVTLVTILFSFVTSLMLEKKKEKKKLILTIAVILLLLILTLVKLKKHFSDNLLWVIVPLGISYYTFSIIGYLVDLYAGRVKAEHNILKYALFVLYYPKAVQGPISKFSTLEPELCEGHKITYLNFCHGLQRILWGYFKKLVIAERIAVLTEQIFDGSIADYSYGGAMLIIATLLATVRHYTDFSGYMDIAIGFSEMLGIRLDENFRHPFFSKSAAEFWRRWHISLGTWFKDYVYMALIVNPTIIGIGKWFRNHISKKASKIVLTILPLLITWFLTGLWHGTGIDYIAWGIYWGVIISLSNVLSADFKKLTKKLKINAESRFWHLFQTIRTDFIFIIGLIISTFVGVKELGAYFKIIFTDFQLAKVPYKLLSLFEYRISDSVILVASIILLFVVAGIEEKDSVRDRIDKLIGIFRWFIYAFLFLAIIYLGKWGPGYDISSFGYAFF